MTKCFSGFHPEQSSQNQMFLTLCLSTINAAVLQWCGRPACLSVSEDCNAFCSSLLLFPVWPTPLLPVSIEHVLLRNNKWPLAWRRQRTEAMEPNFQHFFRPLIFLTFYYWQMWSWINCPLFGPRKSKHTLRRNTQRDSFCKGPVLHPVFFFFFFVSHSRLHALKSASFWHGQ